MDETRLSRETVVDSALALVDAAGLDALTIRKLAQVRGVTPMALYWHFKNKEELLVGVAERLWSLVDNKPDPTMAPLEQMRALMRSILSVMRAHPQAVPTLTMPGAQMTPGCFDAMESALDILARLGFTTQQAGGIVMQGLRLIISLVTGEPGAGAPGQTAAQQAEEIRHKRIMLGTLPPDRYPHVIGAANDLTSVEDLDAYYDLGIELFLAGLEAMHTRQRSTS